MSVTPTKGFLFIFKERLMGEVKNVIETIVVVGKEMAIERWSDNVWVNNANG